MLRQGISIRPFSKLWKTKRTIESGRFSGGRKIVPTIGTCKLCRREGIELLESHFVSRKHYYSGKKRLEFVNFIESGFDPEELKAHLLCQECEARFSVNGEDEVLRHAAAKYVLKALPLAERMRVGWARDDDPSAPRHDARDFDIDTDKFAYFALSIVWRRTIHQWSPAIPRWELGQFAEDMRQYLLGETPFPGNMSILVMVCSDEASRRMWTVPTQFVEVGCLNFVFDVRGIRFRVMMGHLPPFAFAANCRAPQRPIFLADCEKRTKGGWESRQQDEANLVRMSANEGGAHPGIFLDPLAEMGRSLRLIVVSLKFFEFAGRRIA
jgi:hypothetical protein